MQSLEGLSLSQQPLVKEDKCASEEEIEVEEQLNNSEEEINEEVEEEVYECDPDDHFKCKYEEFLDVVTTLLKSSKIKGTIAEESLSLISEALNDEIQSADCKNTCPCNHDRCQDFNAKHHQECEPCETECKNICLIEHEEDKKEETEPKAEY